MRLWMFAGAGALALAACSPAAEEEGRNMTADEVAAELAGVQIRPGEWESNAEVVEVSAPGMPPQYVEQMKGARPAARHCITPEQAQRPDANFLAAQQRSDCTYRDFSMRGGRMRGTMVCSGGEEGGQMEMAMEGQYGPESYDMTMQMAGQGMGEGQQFTMRIRTTGRRLGDCPAGGAGQ
jgi:hypothetical protein